MTLRVAPHAALLLALLGAPPGTARAEAPGEGVVKAAFVVRFLEFTELPVRAFAGPASPIAICVVGDDAVLEALARAPPRTVAGRPVEARRPDPSAPAELARCHVLFVGQGVPRARARAAIASVRELPVLTIGEADGFLDDGGSIRLFRRDDRFAFEIATPPAQRNGIVFRAQLLRVASRVLEGGAP